MSRKLVLRTEVINPKVASDVQRDTFKVGAGGRVGDILRRLNAKVGNFDFGQPNLVCHITGGTGLTVEVKSPCPRQLTKAVRKVCG